jgi:hypothetical protein
LTVEGDGSEPGGVVGERGRVQVSLLDDDTW